MSIGLLPLPSLLRASAQDAGCAQMRKAGRKKWSRADFNASVTTLERLVAGCYGVGASGQFRFQIASELERRGDLALSMTPKQLNAAIDDALNASRTRPEAA